MPFRPINAIPPIIDRWKLELTRLNKSLPNIVAMVGRIRPPHIVRVNETGSELDVYDTAGVLGKYWLFASKKIHLN